MSTPRDRDGFDDRSDDSNGWQEPAHLSGEGADRPADRPEDRTPDDRAPDAAWQPPGWDLPPSSSGRPDQPTPPAPGAGDPGPPPEGRSAGGLFGGARRPRTPGAYEQVFRYEGDMVGAQGWAMQHGWTISDGSGPEDAGLRDLIAAAPVRLSKDHRPAGVMRGRAGNLDLVAFDVVYASGRYLVPEYAVTAAPLLGAVPAFRLSPARLWKHGIGGLMQIPSGNELFDSRWMMLAAEDGPQVRHLVGDPTVQGLLLGTDDGDEFWTAAGHVAAVRLDGHRPQLLEHHTRLLTAVVGALTAASY
jgi:hypothetical protein